jgi:adenylate cyclase 10
LAKEEQGDEQTYCGVYLTKGEFYFAASNDLDVEQWTIFLEFAKAKAIYDDFVENFGKIQFPIG